MPIQPGSPAGQMPASDDAIIRRIQELERAMREIVPSVAESFGPVISDLQDAQATLAAQVAAIAALVNAQVSGDTSTTFASGLSLTSTPQAVASVTVTVPSGYTVARVMAVSALSAPGAVNCTTRIAGNDGGMLTGVNGVATSAHSRTITGLSGGATITASTMAAAIPNTGSGMANTTVFVLFFR